jgi:Icc protein
MKIVQLSDTHIGTLTDATLGFDVRRNFEFILEEIVKEAPGLIVHTGDLCFDQPDPKIYQWIHQRLAATGLPFEVISGNHDDAEMISAVFGRTLQGKEYYYTLELAEHQLIFLDTTSGSISQPQYEWLTSVLANAARKVLLFMHHPPIKMGVPFIDVHYAFEGSEQFCSLTDQYQRQLEIFCGHYHVARQVKRNNCTISMGPSTYFELNEFKEEFGIASSRIGYAVLETSDALPTAVSYKYFKGFTLPLYA